MGKLFFPRSLFLAHRYSAFNGHGCALTLDCYRARNLTGYRDLEPSRARELARYRNLDIDQYLYDDLNRALYLVLNLERDLYLDPAIALNYNRYEVSRFLRWYIRFCTLILGASVAQIMVEEPTSWVAPVQIGTRSGLDYELESLISTYTELYVTFAILEERTQGNEPAFEGIRLVMEKKKGQMEKVAHRRTHAGAPRTFGE